MYPSPLVRSRVDDPPAFQPSPDGRLRVFPAADAFTTLVQNIGSVGAWVTTKGTPCTLTRATRAVRLRLAVAATVTIPFPIPVAADVTVSQRSSLTTAQEHEATVATAVVVVPARLSIVAVVGESTN